VVSTGLKQIIMWSSCVDSLELHVTDDSRQAREEEATQNKRRDSQDSVPLRVLPHD
jgi:hypothetical protein